MSLDLVDGSRSLRFEGGEVNVRSFSDCKEIFKGAVFLLASGPSAKDFPARKYSQYPFLAMNGSILRCLDEGIRPLFYLCDDASFAKRRADLALLGLHESKHAAMSLEVLQELHMKSPGCLERRSIYLLERVNRFSGKKRLSDKAYAWSIRRDAELFSSFSLFRSKPNRIGFSTNMEKGYFVARTIPYVGLQLSCHLGFEQAFLVGVDLAPARGRCYEEGANPLPTTLDEDYHDYILPAFKLAASRALPRCGLKLYNLSSSGRLPNDLVPRVDEYQLERILGACRF